jgi:hypothetical protein
MNIKSHVKVSVCMVLFTAPLMGGGCQIISQTTEPEYKTVISDEKPMHLVRDRITIKESHSLTDLSDIALKSMQIAEDKAKQNDGSAIRRQAELQHIIEQYFNK